MPTEAMNEVSVKVFVDDETPDKVQLRIEYLGDSALAMLEPAHAVRLAEALIRAAHDVIFITSAARLKKESES